MLLRINAQDYSIEGAIKIVDVQNDEETLVTLYYKMIQGKPTFLLYSNCEMKVSDGKFYTNPLNRGRSLIGISHKMASRIAMDRGIGIEEYDKFFGPIQTI